MAATFAACSNTSSPMPASTRFNLDHQALLGALLPALLEAGGVEMRYFEGTVVVERKGDRSPVTVTTVVDSAPTV